MSYPGGEFSTGYPYPTIDPQYLFRLQCAIQHDLKHSKEVAEEHLKKENYKQALEIYSKQLQEVNKSLVRFPDHMNDIPPLLINRSLVYIKLNDLSLALKDADECLQNFPHWRKGYLRKYQALICISDVGVKYDALRSLVNGLVWSFGPGNYDENDHVTFLTEIAKTIPSLRDDPENLLGQIIPPTKNSNFVVKMLENMVASKHWEGVNVIVIAAHKGPSSCLDGIGDKLGKNVPVGTILKLPGHVLKGWELKLCAILIRNGSPVKNIEAVHDQPPVHVGVSIALETECTDLLKSIIDVSREDDLNARNSKNESALHLVLKSKKVKTQLRETLLQLLLNHGCQIDIPDAKNCLKPSDPNYRLLVEAEKKMDDKQCIEAVIQNEQFILIYPLVKKGADPKYVSLKEGDTPVHAALFIGLNYCDDFSLLDLFIGMWESDEESYKYLDPNQQDSTGDGLFHLVAQEKYTSKLEKVITLLIDRKVNINLVNNDNKRPFDYLTKQDKRKQLFKQARSEPMEGKPKKKTEVLKILSKDNVTEVLNIHTKDDVTEVSKILTKDDVTGVSKIYSKDDVTGASTIHTKDDVTEVLTIHAKDDVSEVLNILTKNDVTGVSKIYSKDDVAGVSKIYFKDDVIDVSKPTDEKPRNKTEVSEHTDVKPKNRTDVSESTDVNHKNKTEVTESTDWEPKNKTDVSESKDVKLKNKTDVSESTDVNPKNKTEVSESKDEELKNKTGISKSIDEELKNKTDVSESTDWEPKNKTDVSESKDVKLKNKTNISESTDWEPKNKTDVSESIDEKLKIKTDVSESINEKPKNKTEVFGPTDEELKNKTDISESINEKPKNKTDVFESTDVNPKNKTEVSESKNEELKNKTGVFKSIDEELKNKTDVSESTNEELKNITDVFESTDVNPKNKTEVFESIDEQLKNKTEVSESINEEPENKTKVSKIYTLDDVTEISKIHAKDDVHNETANASTFDETSEKPVIKCELFELISGQNTKQKLVPLTTTSSEVLKKKLEKSISGLPFYPYRIQEVKVQQEKSIEESDDAEQESNSREASEVESDNQEEINLQKNDECDVQAFDNLEWEVECTANVWKTLSNRQTMPDQLKKMIIRKIQQLASGEWTKSLCRTIENVPENLKIFEAKLSQNCSILWEVAVAFSPRLSESVERRLLAAEDPCDQMAVKGGRVYSEIIRVWDIVLDHCKLKLCVQNIIKSYQRGEQCIIQKTLKGIKQTQFKATDAKRVPMIFAESNTNISKRELQDDLKQFYPPASSNEEDYHILKFYSFSSNLVQCVLQKMDINVDFPFRVTDLQHAIIHLNTESPILLFGRSGTGKTTCCLYRLWANFSSYWQSASEAQAPLLPRSVNFVRDYASEEEGLSSDEEKSDKLQLTEEEIRDIEEKLLKEKEKQVAEEAEATYDHLHQVFITKSIVLCSEVKKNFCELSHACKATDQHIAYEDKELPSRLQDIDEYQYPLFVTAKQLLLRLDASLDPPFFFDRNMDKSLKVEVEGWSDDEVLQQILPLFEGRSYDADEEENDKEKKKLNKRQKANVAKCKRKQYPKKEVTYQVFCNDVWIKIANEYQKRFHPSLIWTEIMSFIRGSYEALLEPQGYLSESMYIELGKKRAPNFSSERGHIYQIFKRYEHFKKKHQLFDETDLVRNVYYRLPKLETLPWVFHQIYVDETQDFTQAELCLLLRICNNPNDMFLTGDTAQSIMGGVSFRFSDIKFLFYHSRKSLHAMGHTHSITVPKKVYQLTHNYRSHAGILSLACSILDIMVRFFPESCHQLEKDQGMFQGPCPVLLECNNFKDLALMLPNRKRVTSQIEFGAHQAVLVVDEEAREKMPQKLKTALVLTIFESKGLEFDDILLYNFFKDSQASKEWRVITQFLQELKESDSCYDKMKNIAEMDTKHSRPRLLNIDPKQLQVLNAELNQLYTAVSCARVNVWIFDEDLEKRAPMFEYFKARKLVKILTTDQVEKRKKVHKEIEDKGFSCADWVKRGNDFMRHNLFDLAAKCFERAGHAKKHKTALAFGRALAAVKSSDKKQRRAEFLKAAELFVECQELSQAIKCVLNVQEKELAANLYEKMGQWEKAAELYNLLKKPFEVCRCLEGAGKIRDAIIIFVDNLMYENAIDVVTRYNRTLEELNMSGKDIPLVLRTHAPDNQGEYSLENLNYLAAEVHCEKGNKKKMLECLRQVARENRLNFLKRRKFFKEVGDILLEEGKHKEAVELFIENGHVDEAVAFGRKSENNPIICECLLIQSHLNIQKIKVAAPGEVDEMKDLKMSTINDLDEVIDKAFLLYDNNLMGQAYTCTT